MSCSGCTTEWCQQGETAESASDVSPIKWLIIAHYFLSCTFILSRINFQNFPFSKAIVTNKTLYKLPLRYCQLWIWELQEVMNASLNSSMNPLLQSDNLISLITFHRWSLISIDCKCSSDLVPMFVSFASSRVIVKYRKQYLHEFFTPPPLDGMDTGQTYGLDGSQSFGLNAISFAS